MLDAEPSAKAWVRRWNEVKKCCSVVGKFKEAACQLTFHCQHGAAEIIRKHTDIIKQPRTPADYCPSSRGRHNMQKNRKANCTGCRRNTAPHTASMQDGRGHSDAIAMLLGRLQVSCELKEQLFVDKLGKCTPEDSTAVRVPVSQLHLQSTTVNGEVRLAAQLSPQLWASEHIITVSTPRNTKCTVYPYALFWVRRIDQRPVPWCMFQMRTPPPASKAIQWLPASTLPAYPQLMELTPQVAGKEKAHLHWGPEGAGPLLSLLTLLPLLLLPPPRPSPQHVLRAVAESKCTA